MSSNRRARSKVSKNVAFNESNEEEQLVKTAKSPIKLSKPISKMSD